MRPNTFYESRQADWKLLTHLLDRCQSEIRHLSPEELDTLGRLYRVATSDLALAQRDFPTHKVTLYLNQLVARAHATIYRGEPLAYNRLLRFISIGYPRLYRRAFPFILTATLLFLIPALAIGVATAVNPESARWLLPTQVQDLIPVMENNELWTDIAVEDRPYTASFIMQNNIQVAFLAFSSGMLFGVGSVYVMVFNGQLLGGLMGLAFHYHLAFELSTFVVGHGVIELSVIMIAGGSGLMLGWAILRPGLLRRRDALNQAAQQAVWLLVGCVPLLVVAGLIEGFISPNELLPWPVKWAVGLGSGALLYGYLFFGGRGKEAKKVIALSSL